MERCVKLLLEEFHRKQAQRSDVVHKKGNGITGELSSQGERNYSIHNTNRNILVKKEIMT